MSERSQEGGRGGSRFVFPSAVLQLTLRSDLSAMRRRRTKRIRNWSMADFDLAIIGGGINGAGLARDAAGRGLKVVLLEQNDLASGTSSASSKLIHGGLRYLEQGALRLVQKRFNRSEKP